MRTSAIIRLIMIVTAVGACGRVGEAQFQIKLPSIPKVEKPKTTNPNSTSSSGNSTPAASTSGRGKRVYENDEPSSAPVVIQPRVFIQAVNTNSYWKMPNARDVTSWIPEIKVFLFWDESVPMQTIA